MRTRICNLPRFFFVLSFAVCAVGQRAVAQVVDIPDPGLQAAIRVALNKPAGDITVADMESLMELDASRRTRGYDAPYIRSFEGSSCGDWRE